ncbi:EAL domain-containing protein [Serratia microhaemolytica]|uniref:sensor domain-containing phosphodiesterase n=1 Tax=Serratia microhaemolytica TaxID=2675110 RepID=UPI000FDEE8D9|nr:EAL domain-containing protein [Serratia microhaemolytica]
MLKIWHKLRDRWWGQPLLMSLFLVEVAGWLSPRIMLPDGKLYLIYMPLALCFSLLMAYGERALLGITLAIFIRYASRASLEPSIIVTLVYLFCLSLCWWGYRWQHRSRRYLCFTELKLSKQRLIWLILVPPLLFIMSLQVVISLHLLPDELGMLSQRGNWLHAMINSQAILMACLSSSQLFYLLLRIIKKPRFAQVLWRRIKGEMAPSVTKTELQLWLLLLTGLLVVLVYPSALTYRQQVPDYSLTLLLPLMLYSGIRFGYQFNCIVWAISLLVLFLNYPGYVQWDNLLHSLMMISSIMLVFSLSILLTSAVHTRQRMDYAKGQAASLNDPVIGLPNLRALKRDLVKVPRSTLCFLRITELDLLSRNYGMQLRIRFKQELATKLRQVLEQDEGVYHLPGYDLVLRLNGFNKQARVKKVQQVLEDFRLVCDGLPIHPAVGVGYCGVYSDISHLHLLLSELSALAEVSLNTGRPEGALRDHQVVQDEMKRKVRLLHLIQHALDSNSVVLMAQPILGTRGDSYYEIHPLLLDDDGKSVPEAEFLPIAHEFGLAYQLDSWVLEQTLKFVASQRETMPSVRFALNLSPSSLCRSSLSQDIQRALRRHHIEPYQLILEVTESHLVPDVKQVRNSLRELHQAGCHISLDNFGTGYASYQRLKQLPEVNTLKIDAQFVQAMLTSRLDYQIVASICKVALMRRLAIVAQGVDSAELREIVKNLGIDYMQGSFIGKPQPLATLSAQASKKRGR